MSGETQIDPTARVDRQATIGQGVVIGPFCTVGPHVTLGEHVNLVANVHIAGHTTIGPGTRIAPSASLGGPPQSTRYRGGATTLVVGADCDIRENVTMNTGTEDGGGATTVGDRCMLMVGAHVGHDCHVGNDVTFANNAVLGGHVSVGDFTVLGGQVAVLQFVHIGEGAMVSGVSGVAADIIPFGLAIGQRAFLEGVNLVGMKRRGFSRDDIKHVWRAYRLLFHGDATFDERRSAVEREFGGHPLVGKIVDFMHAPRHRPLMMPERSGKSAEPAAAVR
ncbi:MAG: acyl-ACP--UDP-N-acetylglucosamine O-acyltransferase [Rhizobiales bacterium]|nr:acyl-ACP--UDP-N-acetylglucosamine O-acyltransferase [Hyphomicrobiales bacterium]